MTHMLMGLAQGKLVVCLEVSVIILRLLKFERSFSNTVLKGGYNLDSISKSAVAVTRTLIGEIPDRIPNIRATDTGIETVQMVAMHQSRFWPCLYPKDAEQGNSSVRTLPSVLSII